MAYRLYSFLLFNIICSLFLGVTNKLIANPPEGCNTFSLRDLKKDEPTKSLADLKKSLDELTHYVELPLQDTSESFTICPEQKIEYNAEILRKLGYLGIAYFEYAQLEKAKLLFEELLVQLPQTSYSPLLSIAHNFLGVIADAEGDWLNAYFHFQNLLKWESQNYREMNASAYLNMGVLYASLEDFDKAEKLYKKGLTQGDTFNLEYGWLLHRMGELKFFQQEYKVAEQFFQQAVQHWQSIGYLRGNCFSVSQLGNTYGKTKSFEISITFLNQLLANKDFEGYDLCQIGLYLNLGKAYLESGNLLKAVTCFNKGAILSKKENANQYRLTALEQLVNINLQQEKIEQAKTNFQAYNQLYESIYVKNRNRTTNSFQRVKAFIDREQAFKLIQQKEIHNARQLKSQRIIITISLGLILLSTLLGGMYFYFYRQKKKSNKLLMMLNKEISNQQVDLQKAKDKIAWQNQELKMQLVKKAMLLGQYGETIGKVKTILASADFNRQKEVILKHLNQINGKALQEELNLQITKTNQEFVEKLSNQFPTLTQSELRLSALLKMNLNTKEIANLTFKSSESIKVARSRLRKKLGLTHNKIAISTFLNQI